MKLFRICTENNLRANGIDKQVLGKIGVKVPVITSNAKFRRFGIMCEAIENPLKRPNAFGGKTPLHIDGVKIECKDVKAREYYRGAKLLLDVGREHLAKSISDAEWIVCLVSDKRYNLATDHRRIFENTAALAEKKFKEVKQSEKHDFMKDLATEADRNLKAVETLRKNVADALSPKN